MTIVDVEHGELIPGQRVVITGNRITAVGRASAVKTLKEAQVVNARGKYLIPGLWDLHVHPQERADVADPLFIANGVTGIRDAHSSVPLAAQLKRRQEILAGTRVGPPRQLLAGLSLGQGYDVHTPELAKHIVDSLKAEGANFLKLHPYSPIAAAAARHSGLPFGGHVNGATTRAVAAAWAKHGFPMSMLEKDSTSAIAASDSGMSILDHIFSAGDLDQRCLGEGASVEQCQPVVDRFRQNGTWWIPTFMTEGKSEFGPISSSVKALHARLAAAREKASQRFEDGSTPAPNWLAEALHGITSSDTTAARHFLSVAQRVGLPILAGTDASAVTEYGFELHAELASYVALGLSPAEALRTATLNPAKLLHGTDSLGTVAPGKLADLVLLDGDPLADITNTTTIRAVIANGRYLDRAALDRLLTAVQSKSP